jgi:hypothetical protein
VYGASYLCGGRHHGDDGGSGIAVILKDPAVGAVGEARRRGMSNFLSKMSDEEKIYVTASGQGNLGWCLEQSWDLGRVCQRSER